MGLNETWKGFMLDTSGMWKGNKLLLWTGEHGSEQVLSSNRLRIIDLSELSFGRNIISLLDYVQKRLNLENAINGSD